MAETVFDIISKDPEKEHVAEEVKPTAMHEHGCDDGHGMGAGAAEKREGMNAQSLMN
jgi:hypothetical protein